MHSVLQVLPAELSVLGVLGLEQHYPPEPCRAGERGPQVQMQPCQLSDTSSWLLCRGGA